MRAGFAGEDNELHPAPPLTMDAIELHQSAVRNAGRGLWTMVSPDGVRWAATGEDTFVSDDGTLTVGVDVDGLVTDLLRHAAKVRLLTVCSCPPPDVH